MVFMTSIEMTGATHAESASPAAGLLTRLRATLARRKVYTRTLKELAALSDRELADIGISRFDIRRIAAQAAG